MKPLLVHQPDAVVVGRAPDAGVRGHRDAEVAGHLERRLLRERRVAGDVEGHLHAHQVVAGVAQPLEQRADGGVGAPLPRAGLDVAVGQHEPARHRAQRVDRRLGVVDGLQVVRPVDGRGDAGVEGLDGRQPVAGGDVLRAELLAVLEVVPDEVLGERPVRAVAAHRRLPHVPVGVDHAGHHDAAGGVDLLRAVGHVEARARPRRSGRRRRGRRRRSGPSRRRPWSARCRRGTPAGGRPAGLSSDMVIVSSELAGTERTGVRTAVSGRRRPPSCAAVTALSRGRRGRRSRVDTASRRGQQTPRGRTSVQRATPRRREG